MASVQRRGKSRISWLRSRARARIVPLHPAFIEQRGKAVAANASGIAFATITADATLPATPFPQKPLGAGWVLDGSLSWSATIAYTDHGRSDSTTVSGASGQWSPVMIDFQGIVQGGTIHLSIRAKVKNLTTGAVDNVTWDGHSKIVGVNPDHVALRDALGTLPAQVIAYKESRFRQFDENGDPKFGPPNGFGVMQIDKNPSATARQIWDWRANVSAGVQRFNAGATVVRQHYANLRAAHATLPLLSDDALSLASYQYYNAGNVAFYWIPNADYTSWVTNPDPNGTSYGDDAARIERMVSSGSPPADW